MEALSAGFCAAALTQTLAAEEVAAWQRRWQQPVLQVVDIQRYPRLPTVASGSSRFYVAASDGQSFVWLLVPPHTPLEEAIAGFELEVGCCVTLVSHTLVTAANGLNVVVPLQVKYTANTLRVLGQPTASTPLFPLSPQSLLQRSIDVEERASVAAAASSLSTVRRPTHRVAVRDFVDNPERALGNWSVAVRVVWRGREYPLTSAQRTFGSNSASGGLSGAPRFVFRCLLVDERGDGVVAAFFGGEALIDRVQLHDCLVLTQGAVKWGVGEVAVPVELQFTEKSVETLVDVGEGQRTFPRYAAALVGEVAEELRSVAAVVESVQVGDFTSVVGVVAAVQNSTQITTKRGRVWRSVVTLTDDDGAPIEGEGRCYVEVTLWGDIAESVEPAIGERWVFHSCSVQLFQQRKTLSSRASTMALQLRPLPPAAGASELCVEQDVGREDVTGDSASQVAAAATAKDGATSHPLSANAADAEKSMQYVLRLHEASPTLPVVARVQEVSSPLLTWTCTACGDVVKGHGNACADAVPECCDACGAEELFPSCHVQLRLSDGLSLASVTAHGSTAEALLGLSAMEVARAVDRRADGSAELCSFLRGAPVLMWLLRVAEQKDEDATHYMATACKSGDYVAGCHTLLTAIDAFISSADGDGVDDVVASPMRRMV